MNEHEPPEAKREPNALDAEIARDNQRLLDEPGYREVVRRMYKDVGVKPDREGPLKEVFEILERFQEHDAQVLGDQGEDEPDPE